MMIMEDLRVAKAQLPNGSSTKVSDLSPWNG